MYHPNITLVESGWLLLLDRQAGYGREVNLCTLNYYMAKLHIDQQVQGQDGDTAGLTSKDNKKMGKPKHSLGKKMYGSIRLIFVKHKLKLVQSLFHGHYALLSPSLSPQPDYW